MTQQLPLVTIVTVTFNSAKTLADTIVSVASQTYPRTEHIIVDGGSTDGTLEVIRAAQANDPTVVRYVSEPDNGIYDAMNKGIALANGDVVGLLNSDDFFIDNCVIQDIVDCFLTDHCDVLYADLVFVDQNDTSMIRRRWIAGRGRLSMGWYPPHPTLYVSKSVYSRLGGYRTDYRIAADYDYMLTLFSPRESCKTSYLPRVIIKMRYGGASTQGLSGHRLVFREARQSLREHAYRFPFVTNILRVVRKLHQLVPISRAARYHLNARGPASAELR